MKTLTQWATIFGTDKGIAPYKGLSPKGYTEVYDALLRPFRNKPITLVELGVQDGGSLRMWRQYFTKFPNVEERGARIIGLDIQARCLEWNGVDCLEVKQVDCTDHKALDKVLGKNFKAHIVIDDASHDTYDVIKAYQWFRKRTSVYYFIEDLHAAKGVPKWLADEHIDHSLEANDRLAVVRCWNQ